MGFDAGDVKDMSMWELNSQMVGWSKQFDEKGKGMSEAEKDDVWEWMMAKDDVPLSHAARRKQH